jgi:hypothetical protein
MKIERTSLNEMTATLLMEDGDVLCVRDAIRQAQDCLDVWNLYLILPSAVWGKERMKLQDMGFLPAGSVSADGVTRMKLRLPVRRSSDGGTLAVETPSNGPTNTEIGAVQELLNRNPEYAAVWKKFTEEEHE